MLCYLLFEFKTNHVSSLSHHPFPPGLPDSWHSDHPVHVGCFEFLVAKISQQCQQLAFEMVKDMCDDIHQEELHAIHSRDFLVPVDVLRKRKYVHTYTAVLQFVLPKFLTLCVYAQVELSNWCLCVSVPKFRTNCIHKSTVYCSIWD